MNGIKNIYNVFVYGIIILMVVIGIWLFYKYLQGKFQKKPLYLMEKTQTMEPDFQIEIPPSNIPLPDTEKGDLLGMTFAFKMYIKNAMENENWGQRYNQLKPVINYSPGIAYHPSENYMEFSIKVKDNLYMDSIQTIRMTDVPLQKWLYFVVVFASNRIRIYLNGEMVISKKIKNPPIFEAKNMYIGELNNNFMGQLGNVVYWNYPMENELIPDAIDMISY